jgi:hypothetical protein
MEVDGPVDRGVVRSARPDEVVATAAESFEAALERLRPLARAIVVKLQDIADRPAEIGVEFGLKMNLEAGLIVAAPPARRTSPSRCGGSARDP